MVEKVGNYGDGQPTGLLHTSSENKRISSASKSEKAAEDLAKNKQFFLQLLTTQLKHQDPLDPMNSKDIANQFALFSSVEQSIHQNQNLEELIDVQKKTQSLQALSFMGKEITYEGDQFYYEKEKGEVSFSYKVESPVPAIQISVHDLNDRLIQAERLSGEGGLHTFTFKGEDLMGDPLESGTYQIKIEAIDEKGAVVSFQDRKAVPPMIHLSGKVTAIDKIKEAPVLSLHGIQVPLDSLLSFQDTPSSSLLSSLKKEIPPLGDSFRESLLENSFLPLSFPEQGMGS